MKALRTSGVTWQEISMKVLQRLFKFCQLQRKLRVAQAGVHLSLLLLKPAELKRPTADSFLLLFVSICSIHFLFFMSASHCVISCFFLCLLSFDLPVSALLLFSPCQPLVHTCLLPQIQRHISPLGWRRSSGGLSSLPHSAHPHLVVTPLEGDQSNMTLG